MRCQTYTVQLIREIKARDEVFFMNFVEDEDNQDDYYGYVYNKNKWKNLRICVP